jgi:hypothetical protein
MTVLHKQRYRNGSLVLAQIRILSKIGGGFSRADLKPGTPDSHNKAINWQDSSGERRQFG